ncbi:MAG: glycosyltransferase 87 family protein [Anaerolineae bacterium]|nr:glycosyltransferase 87 family protein [Anaerolineae bacterium]
MLLLVLFITFRFFTALLYRPGGYVRDYSDFVYYLGGASQIDRGAFPFRDYWSEYPPPFPWLTVALYQLVRPIPLWEDDRLWFHVPLALFLLACETVSFLALYGIALHTWDKDRAVRTAWLYAGLFVPVYTMTSAFDSLPLAFLLLGLWAILAARPVLAGLLIGAGTAIKLFPIVLLGPALRALRGWGSKIALIGAGLLVMVPIAAIAYALSPAYFMAFARSLVARSSWSTIWALLDGFDRIGAVVGDRADPLADVSLHASRVPWALVTLVFGLIYLAVWTRRRHDNTPHRVLALTGFTVALLFLYFKAWNPQYLVYLLPLIILLMPHLRGLTYVVLFTGLNTIEHPILASMLSDAPWLLGAVVLARTGLLTILTADFALITVRPSYLPPSWWPRAVFIAAGLVVLAGIALLKPAWNAYISSRLIREPYAATIALLQAQRTIPQETVITTDGIVFRHLYPFLRDQVDLVLAPGPRWDALLEKLPHSNSEPWIWVGDDEGTEFVERLAAGRPMMKLNMPRGSLYRVGADPSWSPAGLGTLGGRFRLINAHVDPPLAMPGQRITLQLYWLLVEPPSGKAGEQVGSYTVFTHLLTPDGTLAAAKDNPPVNGTMPTDAWPERTVIVDRYRLKIPWDARAGDYWLEVGMYDPATGVRLNVVDAFGQPAGDRILLPLRVQVLPRLWRHKP